MAKVDWASLLEEENAEDLWNGLYQLVSRHPVVRPLHYSTDGAAVASRLEINADLTQELFLQLLQKRRFDYYVASGYTSTNIENELVYIELPNLVGARLRSRYPESFRMARRVSSLLKTSSRFLRVSRKAAVRQGLPLAAAAGAHHAAGAPGAPLPGDVDDDAESESDARAKRKSNGAGHERMVNQVYGLREWRSSKTVSDTGRFEDLVKEVPMRQRDTRVVGRSGSSQLIISNRDLEDLIVEILRAIDSPADVRTIRQLVLSRIPLQDYRVGSLDEAFSSDNDGGKPIVREALDTRLTPESELLDAEHSRTVRNAAAEFLTSLRRKVNNNQKRYERLVQTMWHVYFDPLAPSQIEIAAMLGVSDSLVSDNRRLIDYELKQLQLSRDEGGVFSEHLRQLVAPAIC